jgi:hypothetical protein
MLTLQIKTFFEIKKILIKIYYFLILKRRISNQIFDSGNLKQKLKKDLKKKFFIPLVETSHYQIFHILALAKSLVLRGHEVKVLICNGFLKGCEIKSFRQKDIKNPCWECKNNIDNILPLFGLDYVYYEDYLTFEDRKKIISLDKKFSKNLKSKIKYKNFNLTKTVNESLVRYYYGKKFFGNYKIIRSDHITTSLKSIIFAEKIFKKWNPDVILNNMSVYSAWEPFFMYFKKKKVKTLTITLTALNKHAIFFNLSDLLLSDNRYNNYLKTRINKKLNLHEKKQLKDYINKRINAVDDHIKKNKIIESGNEETLKILKFLKIEKHKKNIFMFTNLYWDLGLSDQKGCYKDVISWVIDTINQVKNDNNINLFIKTHPGEIAKGAESLTTILDVVKQKIKKIPINVFFITPEKRINVYSLSKYIDLVVIYTSTLGLEMMLLNVPVINTGKVPYDTLQLSISPKNKKNYYNELKRRENTNPFFRKEVLETYAYFYFIKSPIPWNLTDKSFGHRFTGYNFEKIESLLPGANPQLDHLCDCIIDETKVPEFW